jgi:hypothetical protein
VGPFGLVGAAAAAAAASIVALVTLGSGRFWGTQCAVLCCCVWSTHVACPVQGMFGGVRVVPCFL